jgi:hypothetical protein
MVNRKRLVLWVVLVGGGAAAAAHWLPAVLETPAPAVTLVEARPESMRPPAAEVRWTNLPARDPIGNPAGELFLPQSWAPPSPPPVKVAAKVQESAPPKPTAPPMPYRVAGKMVHEDRPQVVLAKGDAVFTVREGDTLDDGYRVIAIGSDHVTLLYIPLGVRETLRLTSSFIIDEEFAADETQPAPAKARTEKAQLPSAAQISWTGPEQVKTGDPFTVALKVSSGQPVRAAPMQLTYDAAILEPVDVRPGKFFAGGLFSYRIMEGSIVVGASGKESVPADAELVIVTFKPIRAGTAELKVASMNLQSAAGKPILHNEPAAFRTAIR